MKNVEAKTKLDEQRLKTTKFSYFAKPHEKLTNENFQNIFRKRNSYF